MKRLLKSTWMQDDRNDIFSRETYMSYVISVSVRHLIDTSFDDFLWAVHFFTRYTHFHELYTYTDSFQPLCIFCGQSFDCVRLPEIHDNMYFELMIVHIMFQ